MTERCQYTAIVYQGRIILLLSGVNLY